MKRLLLTFAAAAAVLVASAAITDTLTFETGQASDYFTADVENEDDSEIKAYDESVQSPAIDPIPYPHKDFGDKYLSIDTGDATLWRTNTAVGDNIYFDMVMQFKPCYELDELPENAKIAVYLNSSSNIVVVGGDLEGNYTRTEYVTSTNLAPNTWARLTVAAETANAALSFKVYLDGEQLFAGGTGVFPSLTNDTTIHEVGFRGTGALDDFVARTTTPFDTYNFTMKWDSGITAWYKIMDQDPVQIMGESQGSHLQAIQSIYGYDTDTRVQFIVKNAAGLQRIIEPTVDGYSITYDAEGVEFGWAAYLGDPVDGAYTIDDAGDLDMLRQGVADGLETLNLVFRQTADIDMTSADPFAGIGTYAKIPTNGVPFLGTYNGQGFTISNVKRAGDNTQGIFNQVGVSGVVENLVVSNMYWDASVAGEYGFGIVGNAGGGATLRNLTAAGEFASAAKPGTHNMAGIVVRACGGATEGAATTIDSCTNNATIYGAYTKLGGICAIVQNQPGFADGKVVFNNCANNGTLVCKRTEAQCAELDSNGKPKLVTGNAGILGYLAGTTAELTGCYGNGVIVSEDGANTDRDGALVGWPQSGTLKDLGDNSAPSNKKMIGTWTSAIATGFQYATVDNGVATTATSLAAGNTYLLEGDVAKSVTPVYTLANVGDTIAFDAALGYTFAGTVDVSDPNMMDVNDSTSGDVTTYTAAGGTAVATVTKEGTTTSYNTLQKAIAAAVEQKVDTVNLVGAASGAVSIPEGITVTSASGASATYSGITSLVGPGTIRLDNAYPPNALCTLLMNSSWNGTLEIYNLNGSNGYLVLSTYGNANSTVRLNLAKAGVNSSYAYFAGTLEIGVWGWTLTGSYSSEIVLPAKLAGAGAITINATAGSGNATVRFTGDVSGFTGNISFGSESNARVAFGSDRAGGASTIYVHQGSSVTNTGTWTASNIIVTGELVANGTVNGTLKSLSGYTGIYHANSATAAIAADSSWTGTYYIGGLSGKVMINNYGSNANATIAVTSMTGGWLANPDVNSQFQVADITAKLRLDGDMTIDNGLSTDAEAWTTRVTKFAYLTGTGDLNFAFNAGKAKKTYYEIKSLDPAYSGTISSVSNVAIKIDAVDFARIPEVGTTLDSTFDLAENTVFDPSAIVVKVAGEADSSLALELVDGKLKVKSAESVPEITPGSSSSAECGSAAAATAAANTINGNKAAYIKAPSGITGDAASDYSELFTARADGTSVVVELNSDGTNALETASTNTAAQVVAQIATITAAASATTLDITDAVPGFYYYVVYSDELATLDTASSTKGNRALANNDGEVELPIPAKAANATAGFYRVKVSVTASGD